jgi:hypothetical protein
VPQAYIETFSLPTSLARPVTPLLRKLHAQLKEQRNASVAALALFMTFVAYLIAFAPRGSSGVTQPSASAAHYQQPAGRRDHVAELDARPPLTLRETQIVSTPEARPARDGGAQPAPPAPARTRAPAHVAKGKKRPAPGARPQVRVGKTLRPALEPRRVN